MRFLLYHVFVVPTPQPQLMGSDWAAISWAKLDKAGWKQSLCGGGVSIYTNYIFWLSDVSHSSFWHLFCYQNLSNDHLPVFFWFNTLQSLQCSQREVGKSQRFYSHFRDRNGLFATCPGMYSSSSLWALLLWRLPYALLSQDLVCFDYKIRVMVLTPCS